CAGRVEVKHQGQLGTMCDDSWDMADAAVVCKQLGCRSAVKAPKYRHFGSVSGPIWMDEVHCRGTEYALSDCKQHGRDQHNRNHGRDAGLMCSGKGPACSPPVRPGQGKGPGCALREQRAEAGAGPSVVEFRLVNGTRTCEGRVEVHVLGTWGSLCASRWDL
ncbi:Deleted in malignant brain tumors 1 protein, partial [Pygoscelis adeliae]